MKLLLLLLALLALALALVPGPMTADSIDSTLRARYSSTCWR